jgi:sec-independent protein translocase protein TatB
MFDIGFSELVLIGIVALLVIGPERLPETIRTASMWLNRIRRGFNEIKQEVQQELHNDAVMRDLRKTGEQLKQEASNIGLDLQSSAKAVNTVATTVATATVGNTVTSAVTAAPDTTSTEHISSSEPKAESELDKSPAGKMAE